MDILLRVCLTLSCVLCAISDGAACTQVTTPCEIGNGTYGKSNSCTKVIQQQFSQDCENTHCGHGYWRLQLNFTNSSNDNCSKFSVRYSIECVSNKDAAEYEAKEELRILSDSNIAVSVPEPEKYIDPCYASRDSRAKCFIASNLTGNMPPPNVRVKFLKKLGNSSHAVAAAVTIAKREVGKVKNIRTNLGDLLRFGDKALLVVAVQKDDDNTSTNDVEIKFTQSQPLDYIDRSIRIQKVRRICVYYDTDHEAWDSSVCNTTVISDNETDCVCEHNSAFAVVFALTPIQLDSTLITVSMVFEIVSMTALLVTLILLIYYRRKLRNFDRVIVQISLCVSLMMAHVFLLLAGVSNSSNTYCQAVIVLSHYFMVSTAILMVMEGGIMLIKVLYPNFGGSLHAGRRRAIGMVLAWIAPIAYVGICAGIGFKDRSYGEFKAELGRFEICVITDSFNLVVVIPVVVALGINAVILIRLGVLVATLSRKAEEFKPSNDRDKNPATHATKALRAVMILLPILGIPWSIGFLINTGHPANAVFASIHVIANGCQGIFIFMHYIMFNSDMAANIRRSWESTKSEMASFGPVVHFANNNRTDSTTVLKFD